MVVPFPPGGNTDLMARALQAELAKALNQSVIISNKGGAAGTIGILDLVRAEPDGYTIALTPNNPITAQPHMQPNLRYGMDTFRYICLTYYTPYVLIAGPQAPFKTFAEFVTFAKAKPENVVYGHPGVAGQPHLVMLSVLKAIGADGLGVPFQGAGPMSHALLGGTIMAITESPAVARASNLPILAAISNERIPGLPDVPTMKELGFPAVGFSAGGLIVPAKTPDAAAAVAGKGLCRGDGRARIQGHRRAARRRAALSAGRPVQKDVRRGFGGERRRDQARRPWGALKSSQKPRAASGAAEGPGARITIP